jgi:hypothetical protein
MFDFNNTRVIWILCGVLFALLLALMICERIYPEAGSELVRQLLHRG